LLIKMPSLSMAKTPSQSLRNSGFMFPWGRYYRRTVSLFVLLFIIWAVCWTMLVSWHSTIQIQMPEDSSTFTMARTIRSYSSAIPSAAPSKARVREKREQNEAKEEALVAKRQERKEAIAAKEEENKAEEAAKVAKEKEEAAKREEEEAERAEKEEEKLAKEQEKKEAKEAKEEKREAKQQEKEDKQDAKDAENAAKEQRKFTTNKPFYPRGSGCNTEIMVGGLRPYCHFAKLLVDLDKIQSAKKGGEPLKEVRGQDESDEMLTYERGAFTTFVLPMEQLIMPPADRSMFYYVNDVLQAMDVVDESVTKTTLTSKDCSAMIPGVTLFLQRYEYVNLYHTMTDWFNTWLAYREYGSANVAGVVFLDAHPAGSLDEVWTTLFGDVQRAQRLTATKSCFESAVLVPAGYSSQIYAWENAALYADPELMNEFVDFVLERLDLQETRQVPGRVVLIDRRPYQAHPRSTNSTDDRMIVNMLGVARSIQALVPEVTSVEVLQLHTMTLREQIQAVREAHVLIGNHGAGLTQLLFLDKDTYVLEFRRFNLHHFEQLCKWKEHVTHYMLPGVNLRIDAEYSKNVLLPILGLILQGRDPLPPRARTGTIRSA
jgi:glycoprotein 2-beta-D-xylosyltransferase